MSDIEWVGWIVTEPHPDEPGEVWIESDFIYRDRARAEEVAEQTRSQSPHRTFRVMRVASSEWGEPVTDEDSNLIKHARRELELAGMLDDDGEYDGMLGMAVLEIVTVFSRQGHSGASAALVTGIVERLLRYDVLTPLTYGPGEWIDQREISGYPIWQNRRKPSVFSNDYGKTHYDLDDRDPDDDGGREDGA